MAKFADQIDYKLKINAAELEKILLAGNPEARIGPVRINDDRQICQFSPYEHSE